MPEALFLAGRASCTGARKRPQRVFAAAFLRKDDIYYAAGHLGCRTSRVPDRF